MLLGALAVSPATAQETPRVLFPPPPPAELAHPAAPAAPIEVQDLAAPDAWRGGLATAEADLGGPLWAKGAPPELSALVARLPAAIEEPTLASLQTALLAAPGPADDPGDVVLVARIERLIAMGEAAVALEILSSAPVPLSAVLGDLQLAAQMATGATKPACDAAAGRADDASPWPEARVACAALAHDATAVELALDRLGALGRGAEPNLAGLARAAVVDGRFALQFPVPDSPLLLPLLRTVPVDVDPGRVEEMPVAARKVLAGNPYLAAAARSAASRPAPPPSVRPELNGTSPADWAAAAGAVPEERRARWAALVDGLGLPIPEDVWSGLAGLPSSPPAAGPDLAWWRGFEVASLDEQRGTMLLYLLLLTDGRPTDAAPVTLRRALDGLLALGLESDARALAAGTGGALGL
ncbi:MAG: hypothetical protein U1E52_20090 [Geminicoccaceae bacterium]